VLGHGSSKFFVAEITGTGILHYDIPTVLRTYINRDSPDLSLKFNARITFWICNFATLCVGIGMFNHVFLFTVKFCNLSLLF
jgi:hypothetical protein